MIIKVAKSKKEIGNIVADIIEKDLKDKNNKGEKFYLGLATGSTPIPVYEELIKRHEKGSLDFFNTRSYNLDEYLGLDDNHEQSYHKFMHDNLFDKINIRPEEINILDGISKDPYKECEEYDKKISETGIDVQILGIGENGHIAFNEPDENLKLYTHVTSLTDSTIKANSRFFESEEEVPTKALTMGMKIIFDAKKVILIATGKNKAKAVSYLIKANEISTNIPASILLLHKDVIFVFDEECYNEAQKNLKENKGE